MSRVYIIERLQRHFQTPSITIDERRMDSGYYLFNVQITVTDDFSHAKNVIFSIWSSIRFDNGNVRSSFPANRSKNIFHDNLHNLKPICYVAIRGLLLLLNVMLLFATAFTWEGTESREKRGCKK
jgi:hypothetical protein